MRITQTLDTVLDKSVVLGYTKIGPALRRFWWPPDPPTDAMAGRIVLVTGSTSGVGYATAAGLARLGATVHVHGHNRDRLQTALEQLRSQVPEGRFHGELCDVGDLADVRRFATEFLERVDRLDALVHNAGIMLPERHETHEGHEITLAVMVLGPHLLTSLLRPRLAFSDSATVAFMSSGGMYAARLHSEDPEYQNGTFSGPTAYARCKRMQVELAKMWAQRLGPDGIEVASMHPGWVDTKGVAESLPRFRALTRPLLRSAEQGADTMVWLVATHQSAAGSTGFWHDRALRATSFVPACKPDGEQPERLWDYVADATDTPSSGSARRRSRA